MDIIDCPAFIRIPESGPEKVFVQFPSLASAGTVAEYICFLYEQIPGSVVGNDQMPRACVLAKEDAEARGEHFRYTGKQDTLLISAEIIPDRVIDALERERESLKLRINFTDIIWVTAAAPYEGTEDYYIIYVDPKRGEIAKRALNAVFGEMGLDEIAEYNIMTMDNRDQGEVHVATIFFDRSPVDA